MTTDGRIDRPTSRAPARSRGRKAVRFPDRVAFAAPPRTAERIEAAAAFDGMSPAEWCRRMVRLALDAARKRRARRERGS